jgi:hypothetical protein
VIYFSVKLPRRRRGRGVFGLNTPRQGGGGRGVFKPNTPLTRQGGFTVYTPTSRRKFGELVMVFGELEGYLEKDANF